MAHHLMYARGSTEATMRTTMNIDDELLKEAHELTGIKERTTLVHEGLRLLIQREALGLRHHRVVDQQFPEPPRRSSARRAGPCV